MQTLLINNSNRGKNKAHSAFVCPKLERLESPVSAQNDRYVHAWCCACSMQCDYDIFMDIASA